MNNDLISRSALLAAYDKAHKGPPGGTRKLIEEAPAVDAVEVVRCVNCKFLHNGHDDYCCRLHIGLVKITPYSFCSYGERREYEAD